MRLRGLLVIMCLATAMIPVGIIGGYQGFQIATPFIGLIVVVTFFASLFMSFFITRSLEKLTKNIDEISKGNLDVTLEKSEIYEINNLTNSLDRVMASLKLAIHKVGVKKEEIFDEAVKAKELAEEKYKNLLSRIDEWIVETDEQGVCTYCSIKVADILGYQPIEILGKKILDCVDTNDKKTVETLFSSMTQQKREQAHKCETRWRHKDGHTVIIVSCFDPIIDVVGNMKGFRGFCRDVTDYKIAEKKINELCSQLEEMKKEMRLMLNEKEKVKPASIPEKSLDSITENEFDYLFVFDEQTHIIDCNDKMLEKLGYTKDEVLALTITDFDTLETNDDLREKIEAIKQQGSMRVKTIHKKKDGSSMLVSENIQYIKDKNIFTCTVKEDTVV